MDLINIIYYI